MRWSRGVLRTVLIVAGFAVAFLVLLTIVQVFVCDARELIFRGLPHRRLWPCEWPRVYRLP